MSGTSVQSRLVHLPDEEPDLEVVRYAPGSVIFCKGSPGYRAFIVQSGLVEISKVGPRGEKVIGYVGGGEVFGELAPLDGEPRMASATALKETVCIVMPENMLRQHLSKADPFVRDLLFVLVRGLRQVTSELVAKPR
ncbi:MAG: cyclic nucleotide-binding domain-containing protein [Alphaproteobacteria bacterium]|nr:cyclic nucleotide-binding domain-containing protein [Alphaproteobacteria bacterium]